MNSDTCFYKVLGVSKDASSSDIARAYKKMARTYHPDKLPADQRETGTQKMKEINEAHAVLNDPEKRKIYDKFGKQGLEGNAGSSGGFHPFGNFGNFGNFSNMFNQHSKQHKTQVPPVRVTCTLNLEQIYTGVSVKKTVERYTLCKACKSTGFADCLDHMCVHCKGKGRINNIVQVAPGMIQQTQSSCNKCNGTGIESKAPKCKQCNGKKVNKEQHEIEFQIPAGVCNKTAVVKENEGHEIPENERGRNSHTRGNVELIVLEEAHPVFSRSVSINGNVDPADIIFTLKVDFADSLVGFKKEFKHLDGSSYFIIEDDPVKDGDIRTVLAKGLPSVDSHVNGNLFVKYQVEFPKQLTEEQKIQLYQILTGNKYEPLTVSSDAKTLTTRSVDEINTNRYDSRSDERFNRQEEAVECATQ